MRRFDLRPTREFPIPRLLRSVRPVLLGIASVIGVLAVYEAWQSIASNSLTGLTTSAVVGELLLLLLLVFLATRMGPGPDSLGLDDAGLELNFANGRSARKFWADPSLRIRMDSTRGAADSVSRGRQMQYMFASRPLQVFLTEEAFEAILDAAQSRGLAVHDRPGPRPGWTRYLITQ
jgi:hypothetical protein